MKCVLLVLVHLRDGFVVQFAGVLSQRNFGQSLQAGHVGVSGARNDSSGGVIVRALHEDVPHGTSTLERIGWLH